MSSPPLRLAYFSPLPPAHSGIADYSRELLPYLAHHTSLTLFAEQPQAVDVALKEQFAVEEIGRFPAKRWQFDLALYQMGNSSHHEAAYRMFTRYPGILVLHDAYLHLFLADRTAGKGEYGNYTRELAYELGQPGIQLANRILWQQKPYPVFEIPLTRRLADLSLGVIVHSRFAQQFITHSHCMVIPALITDYPGTPQRQQLPWPPETVIFASVGQITTNKQVDFALRAFQQVHDQLPHTAFLLVGEQMPEVDVAGLVQQLGLETAVFCTGYVAGLQNLVDWIHTADVIINLRYPTLGETSAIALRALAAKRPLIVFDHGWYSELPNDAALKLPVMDEPALIKTMLQLAQDLALRQQLGQAGWHYATEQCHPSQVALAYNRFCHQILRHIEAKYA